MFLLAVLSGCAKDNKELERGMALRSSVLKAEACSFRADITADYGDKIQQFSMDCQADRDGTLVFCVSAPETIAGITGRIDEEGGALTFDDVALHFYLLADETLSPVSAPWVLMKTLRSGYLTTAGMDGERLQLTIHDSYEEDALQVDIWLNEEDLPVAADILHEGRRILSLDIKDFVLS